jgi:hypothetical protein
MFNETTKALSSFNWDKVKKLALAEDKSLTATAADEIGLITNFKYCSIIITVLLFRNSS